MCHDAAVDEPFDVVGAAADAAAVPNGSEAVAQVAVGLRSGLHQQLHRIVCLCDTNASQECDMGMQVNQTWQ